MQSTDASVTAVGVDLAYASKKNQKLQTRNGFITPKTLPLSPGKVLLFSRNMDFGKGLERISLSAGWAMGSQEPWYVLSGDAASKEVFIDYLRRFGIRGRLPGRKKWRV